MNENTEALSFPSKIQDFGIEYKSISQHFSYVKIIDKMLDYQPLFKATSFIPSREPPGKGLNNLSKIANY